MSHALSVQRSFIARIKQFSIAVPFRFNKFSEYSSGVRFFTSATSYCVSSIRPSFAIALQGTVQQRSFHISSYVNKDKMHRDVSAGPRKSKFANDEPKEKKIRTPEEKAALDKEREERSAKKKEIHDKQIEIQRKREEAKAQKEANKGKKNSEDKNKK